MADSGFFSKIKNFVLGKKEAQELAGDLKDFNQLTSNYISALSKEVENKKKKVNSIRILVNDALPKSVKKQHDINIQLVDMNKTKISQKGKGSYNAKMDWEKKMRDYKQQNRGKLI